MTTRVRLPALAFSGLVGLVIGMICGVFVSTKLSRSFWTNMSYPAAAATGDQAYTVVTLLDRGRYDELKDIMNIEIDHALGQLTTMAERGSIDPSSPALHVLERLRRYRSEHPLSEVILPPSSRPSPRGGLTTR